MSLPARGFDWIVSRAARRPRRILAGVALLAAIGAILGLRLEPTAATDTLVGRGSATFQATERYRESFGDHAIVILVRGDLERIVLNSNLGRLIGLEGCIGGNKPPDQAAPGGPDSPCDRFARFKPVKVVYGPGTFINTSVAEIQEQLGGRIRAAAAEADRAERAAREVAQQRGRSVADQKRLGVAARRLQEQSFTRDLLELSLRYGLGTKVPRVDDVDFVSRLVFDPSRGPTTPKARFAYLFPNERSAVIQVRLKPDLSDAERAEAVALVREAVRMKEWRPQDGVSYTVTGVPVLADELTDSLADSTATLLVIALLVMAGVLALLFRSRLRLVPLAVSLSAVAMLFGAMSLVGAPLTMASIAVLPVLLGLGVDYAIQYQVRVQEAEVGPDPAAAALRAARVGVPTIATAALATVVGFGVLLLSPVPMVRGFGLLLVAGVSLAFVLALSAGTAALVAAPRGRGGGMLARSERGANELLAGPARILAQPARGAGRRVLDRPWLVLAVGFALAASGWIVDSRTEVVSDLNELVPQDLPALRDLNVLQEATDVAGEVDVVVEGDDLTQPQVIAWMRGYQAGLLKRYGYSARSGCGQASLCPALSLPDLFRNPRTAARRADVRALLDQVPPYFSQAVITPDRRTANLAFGIKLESLERQREIMLDMRARLASRPPGVRAELAGLPVLAAEANAALASPLRRLGTLAAGLLAVAIALLLVYRRWKRAWVPLVPIVLATGWSALVLFVLGVALNPLSAAIGTLVIAISTEFSVLLSARFHEEREAGHEPREALRRTYRSTGAAVLASGVTAIAGFAVLAFSDVQMLKDFGLVTVVGLSVSLLGVLAVLPAVLMLAEGRSRTPVAAGS